LEVFNRSLALDRLHGDETRLRDLLFAFQKNVPFVLEEMAAAWRQESEERLESLAVELRESVRRIGAEGLEELASRMIAAAREKDFAEAEVLVNNMEMELDWLLRILDENRCSGNL
jgi:hypothetical protein